MRVGKLAIGDYGQYVVPVPTTSKFHSARQAGSQFEIFYSFATDGTITMLMDFRVVDEYEPYDDNYIYIDKVINAANGNVKHVLYRPAQGGTPTNPIATPY